MNLQSQKADTRQPTHINIGRIQYINVNPVYHEFENKPLPRGMRLFSEPPATLNRMLREGELDISSVSASAFARNSEDWLMLPDMSIACYGKVMSVLLVSRHAFRDLHTKPVFLTDESATAVDLVKLLFALQGVDPEFERRQVKSPDDLTDMAGAGLVIGDAALKHNWHDRFDHVWDLCEMWNDMTGLPFVFAVWAVRRSFAKAHPESVRQVMDMLQHSKDAGLADIDRIAETSAKKLGIDLAVSQTYFKSMYYSLSDPEIKCLTAFFKGLFDNRIIETQPEIAFF
ncbi:MAG: ABC transporter substrate-binding protein [Desulfobacteraceae bacterium]|nr:MAG: ABC transporter substrate-binding protein [Desulfobacteraceae bacterium]